MKLYGQATSGNCWKVAHALFRSDLQLSIPGHCEGETQEDWYRQINPVGKIRLVGDSGETLNKSNAILGDWRRADWWPTDVSAQSRLSWLFWEQYSHEPALAVARSWKVYRGWDQSGLMSLRLF